jgi:F-type H+-transporting ATPase subunit b
MDAVPMPASTERHRACEFRRKLGTATLAAVILAGVAAAAAQTPTAAQAPDAHAPARPADTDTHQAPAESDHAAEDAHGGGLSGLLWPTANFLVLVGALYYFLKQPFSDYLTGRSNQIRKDLVEAAALNQTATAQLAEVDAKVKALPAEIEALRSRGSQEIAAEEARIAREAEAERERLLTQTRREIEVRLRAAQRELSEHASSLALDLARQRLSTEMTPADHARLVDRYIQQVEKR